MKRFIVFDSVQSSPLGIYVSEFIISDAIICEGRELIHAELPEDVDPYACKPEKIDGVWMAVPA